jgi:hypothetical protein
MASYAFVAAELKCLTCATPLTDMVWFQWGYCPGLLPRPDRVYQVGDALYWRPCDDGSIRTWAFFDGGGLNVGDPAVRDVVARDSGQWFLAKPCSSCGGGLGGGVVEISDGVISRVSLARPDEFIEPIDEVNIYTVSKDGARVPRPDLQDHPMKDATDCVTTDKS